MPVIEVRRYNRRETTKTHGYHGDISESLLMFSMRGMRRNVPPSHTIRESLTAFSGGRAGATSLHHMLFGKAWRLFWGDVREQRPAISDVQEQRHSIRAGLTAFFPFYPHGSCIYEIIFVPLQRVCLRSRPVFCHSAAYLERLGCRTDLRCRQAHQEKRIPRNRNKTDD